MTNRDELRAAYTRLKDYVQRGHFTPERERQALADLTLLGAALAKLLGPEQAPTQQALLDAKKRRIVRS